MKLMLAFLLVTFALAVWATQRDRPTRAWTLALASLVVAAAYLSRRVI